MNEWREPVHPGEVLAGELEEIGINAVELATRIKVPDNRIYQILNGDRSITADTALRLGKFFGTGAEFWLNLQKAYELAIAQKQIGENLEVITPYKQSEHIPTAIPS